MCGRSLVPGGGTLVGNCCEAGKGNCLKGGTGGDCEGGGECRGGCCV